MRVFAPLIAASEEERALLPRSFDVVGEIVVIRLPREWRARRAEIGAALLEFVPRARLVGWDQGVHGEERRRTLERIAGDGPWTTVHRENGIDFSVDLEAAYFSPRLAREHARVAATVREGATVYDLACGVGPFSVQIARDGRAGGIVAIDANPAAIRLLRATLGRLPYGGRVTPVEGRIEAFLPGRAPCDLAVLNLPHEGIKYAPSVARAVAPGGRFSYYEIVARSDQPRRGNVVADALGPAGRWTVAETHVVHPYSPDADLVGFTFDRATE